MKWVTVWGNATSVADRRPENYARNITLRYPVRCAFGGDRLRLRFSNFCGTEAVTLTRVTVAPALSDREINAQGARLITFGGKESVTIGAGEEIISDETDVHVKPKGLIAVSIYLGDFTLMRSAVVITGALSKGFFSLGDDTLMPVLPLDYTRSTQTFYFLTGIDLYTEDDNFAVVAYGDSITAQSYPDLWQQMRLSDPYNRTAIIRRAASGTRVLREYKCITYESYGLCGKNRFLRELSTVSGAKAVLIQQGINDIIHPVGTDVNPFRPMSDLPTVEELTAGLEEYIRIAKSLHLKAYMGTLLPIKGWRTYAPFREEMKNAVNEWIRNCPLLDGVADFDEALRSPTDPASFALGNDSGDHLHPSEAAYDLMASEADVALGFSSWRQPKNVMK